MVLESDPHTSWAAAPCAAWGQPWVGRGNGLLTGFMSTGPGADPLGPVTWLGNGPCIMGKGHSRSTYFIPTGALALSLVDTTPGTGAAKQAGFSRRLGGAP